MAENDNNAGGINNDPLKMRNTETAALKRIPVSPNSASASSAARKTIKLKPLMPSSSAGRPMSPAAPASPAPPQGAAPKTVAPPSFLLNRKPAAPAAEEPPKFMSTNTAPISKMAAPEPQKPIPAAELHAEPVPTKTVSIPRLQAKMAPKPAPAAPQPYVSTATAPIAAAAQPPPQKPLAAAALGSHPAPPTVKPAAPTAIEPAPAPAVSTTTQGIQKQTTGQAEIQSGLQSAKSAIKLRPSNAPAQGEAALSTDSPTIKLTPQTSSAVTPVPPAAAQAEAPAAPATINLTPKAPNNSPVRKPAPTINLTPKAPDNSSVRKPSSTINLTPKAPSATPNPESAATAAGVNDTGAAPAESAVTAKDVTVTTKIPRSKPRLKPIMPGAAANSDEAKLREQGDIANQKMEQRAIEDEQTIKQESTRDSQPGAKANAGKKDKKGSGEPHMIFAISAILAFLVIGYMVFALTAQYLTLWEQKSIPVVGFQQLDEQLNKK